MASIRENTVDKYYNNRFLLPQCNTSCTATQVAPQQLAAQIMTRKFVYFTNITSLQMAKKARRSIKIYPIHLEQYQALFLKDISRISQEPFRYVKIQNLQRYS